MLACFKLFGGYNPLFSSYRRTKVLPFTWWYITAGPCPLKLLSDRKRWEWIIHKFKQWAVTTLLFLRFYHGRRLPFLRGFGWDYRYNVNRLRSNCNYVEKRFFKWKTFSPRLHDKNENLLFTNPVMWMLHG
jgi:hypothetical protein